MRIKDILTAEKEKIEKAVAENDFSYLENHYIHYMVTNYLGYQGVYIQWYVGTYNVQYCTEGNALTIEVPLNHDGIKHKVTLKGLVGAKIHRFYAIKHYQNLREHVPNIAKEIEPEK